MPPTESNPLNLIWCDLEFTHLDLARTRVLQAAMLVTTPDLEPVPPRRPGANREADPTPTEGPLEGLNHLVRITPEEAASASDWVRANQAELLARCQTDAALPPAEVERRMIDYLEATCVPTGSGEESKPLLAGNTVHMDRAVLERCMPELARRLHYRLVDVSGLKELRRRWYPGVPEFEKPTMARDWLPDLSLEGEEHDALFDVKCSLAELRYYRETLFRSP